MTDREAEGNHHEWEMDLPEYIPVEDPEVEDAIDHALHDGVEQLAANGEQPEKEKATDEHAGQQGGGGDLQGVDNGQAQLMGSGPPLPPRQQNNPAPARPEASHPEKSS